MSQGKKKHEDHAMANPAHWLSFPALDRIFASDVAPSIALLEQRVQELQPIAESGPAAERARARLACPGYRHALALLNELRQARDQLVSQQVSDRTSR
jgi:hypothetical protein